MYKADPNDSTKQIPKAISDILKYEVTDPSMPSGEAVAVSNNTDYAVCRSVFIGGGGNIVLKLADGKEVTFNNVDDGSILPIRATRINSSGTTAADVVFLY